MTALTPQPSICVYCGSRPGADSAYMQDATGFGTALAREGWRLVYGAGDVGLMGAVARAAQSAGGDTFGVIPSHLMQLEVGKRDLTRFVVTENMHERKKVMFMNSDAIVVLPGGAGSLDEFFEVLTWAQLGLHAKPILLLDTRGYWGPLTTLVDHVIAQGFADASLRDFITRVDTPETAISTLRAKLLVTG
ncbi:TIGR00730 family Rossman fold protein [Aquicoccus porphyridii]|uniref:Cytokinin riboside 5'-monophosphate phosphoribohydrolase n=1 Tax=Aquicoccus porphyridii TaxID=1852029 RepID=A0A5A9ZSV5_9RHOB|nr:TIGR00730 family Rossman fold protein [Aquicoccus porphyridii]KAA0920211.1 TIGR00730 family Rossman fold protein [Aquicoccus porphyridii]RAI54991.1 TIGR00730 family Rossman fold protein [Rhodobacteraceae bacterium AsT-22]